MISDIYNSLTPKEKYLIAKYGYNMARGYLRGTKAFQARRAPTLANKVTRLERQVNRQKPERIHSIKALIKNTPLAQFDFIEVDVTRELINNTPFFRENITGDKWYNHFLQFKLHFNTSIQGYRIIIYTPKRSGSTTAGLGANSASWTAILDPTAFQVHLDRYYNSPHTNSEPKATHSVRLNSLTQFNSEVNIIDRNNVRVFVLWETKSAGDLRYEWDLTVTNK